MKDCKWITSNVATGSDNQLYYFKKKFDLKVVKEATVEISAQARYKLFINGECVGVGLFADERVFHLCQCGRGRVQQLVWIVFDSNVKLLGRFRLLDHVRGGDLVVCFVLTWKKFHKKKTFDEE